MKIIYIVNTRMPNQRAHGFQIAKTCEKFAELGHRVELWYPKRKSDLDEDVFSYYGLKRNFKTEEIPGPDAIILDRYIGPLAYYVQSFLFALKLFFRKLSRGALVYTRDFFAAFIFGLRGYDAVYNVHNWSGGRELFYKFFLLFLAKKPRAVCNSEGTRKMVGRAGFGDSIAVPNGVDLEDYATLGDQKALRKGLGLPADKKIVMYVGNFYPWKGVSVVLDCARSLTERGDIVFVVVGGDEDDLKKYIPGAPPNVIFAGHQVKKVVPRYLKAADVLLLPNIAATKESINYTSPIKMFEYMAADRPIIASDLPSLREVLNEDNALIVPPGRPEALARGIERILTDGSLARRISGQALIDVKKYTWDEYAKKILNFLSGPKHAV